MLWFNDTSTLMGHFVLSPREREKRDRRDNRGDERERQEIVAFPGFQTITHTCAVYEVALYFITETSQLSIFARKHYDEPM